jgi:signal transduction histidine kinase
MWQLALATNLTIALSYAGVAHHVGSHLTRTRQWRANQLAAIVVIVFASCSVSHIAHSAHLILDPRQQQLWSWHMLAVDLVAAAAGVWYFYERFREPKLSRGAALFEDSNVRRRDAMEIHDNVVQALIAARYALDRGDGRDADAAIAAAVASARGVITELLPPGRHPDLREPA